MVDLNAQDGIEASMLARLRALGLKITPQRLAVVRELAGDGTHPTAQELYERLLRVQPTLSFATVYNTLDALAGAGLVAARALAPGPTRFDPNVAPHDHAVCERCGAVVDLVGAPDLAPLVGPPGFRARAVERVLRGTCAACHASGGAGPVGPPQVDPRHLDKV